MSNKTMSRKFRYGAVSTVFTVIFIVAVILFNAIISAFDSKYSFHIDLTGDKVFSISDTSVELVKNQIQTAKNENNGKTDITISFLAARDKIVKNENYSWVVNLAESYAEKFDEIKVEFKEDVASHPENYAYYTELGNVIDSTRIIVSNSTSKAAFKIFTFDSCMIYDENNKYIWAFKGEMMLNSAIMSVTSKSVPVIAFTKGHGEKKPTSLVDIFMNSGFDVREIDLSKEDITDDVKLLVISSPTSDIISVENDKEITEYTKISEYLNQYRNLMVLCSPSTPELPVLDEILEAWGMKLVRNQIIFDDVSSVPGSNSSIFLDYVKTDGIASALTSTLTQSTSAARCVTNNNAPIEIINSGDGEYFAVESVLESSTNSYVESVDAATGNTVKAKGPYSTMAIATRFTIENNNNVYSHLLLIGSTDFSEISAYKSQYGNTEVLNNAIRLLTNESVKVDLEYKVLDESDLSEIENGDVINYAIICAGVIPCIIFAVCIFVCIKRKHL